jgi:hypothetical protein
MSCSAAAPWGHLPSWVRSPDRLSTSFRLAYAIHSLPERGTIESAFHGSGLPGG